MSRNKEIYPDTGIKGIIVGSILILVAVVLFLLYGERDSQVFVAIGLIGGLIFLVSLWKLK